MARLSQSELARLRGCSRQAIRDAVNRGAVVLEADGSVDVTRPENAVYLQHRGRASRPAAGTKPRTPRRPKAAPVAPEIGDQGDAEGDEDLPASVFVPPDAEGVVYVGQRLQAQKSRIIAAIRLFRHKLEKLRAGYVPTRLASKVLGWHVDHWAGIPDAFDGLDMLSDDLWMDIDERVNVFTDGLRDEWAEIVAEIPTEPTSAMEDGLDALDLESLRSLWDSSHAERTRFLLSVEKGEFLTLEDFDARIAALNGEIKVGIYNLGRRCSARCRALAESGSDQAARAYLRREAADAVSRLERHRLTAPA